MTVYLVHAFDLFNVEHVGLIRDARELGDRLVVAVLSDETVESITGRPPVVPLPERLEIVRHARGVDDAVVHGEEERPPGERFVVAPADVDVWPGAKPLPTPRVSASTVLRNSLRNVRSAVA